MLCPPSHYAPDTTRKKDLSSDQSELDELPEEPGVLKAMYSICLSDIIKEVDEGLVKLGYIKEDNEMK